MKASEIRKKTDKDLQRLLVETKEELRVNAFGAAGTAKGGSTAANLKKTIARISTEISARKATTTNQ